MSPAALFVSPHLDDVAFSCAGTAIALGRAGWRTVLLTPFTASVPDPTGFALRCQTDKGLGPEVDYMALRRAEDAEFAARAGIDEIVHLPLREAPHRGYESPEALFAGVRGDDTAAEALADPLGAEIARVWPELVFGPTALGGHVDHLLVRSALEAAVPADRLLLYRDLSYAARLSGVSARPGDESLAVEITADLERKLAACEAYVSQLQFQFGGPEGMRATLGDFARAEAERAGLRPHAAAEIVSGAGARRLEAPAEARRAIPA